MHMKLRGSVTYETRDKLGPILVIDHGKHRILSFDSVFEQSKIKRKSPHLPVHEYNRAMLLPLAWAEPGHATVLGLGGGVLVTALHYLLPACNLHAVELRSQVIDVAREFFGLPDTSGIKIINADARPALRGMEDASTDLILTDLYDANRMSPAPAQSSFIAQCERVLAPEGWLAINYHQLPDPRGPLFQQICRLFASVLLFRSRTNNYVLYAAKTSAEPLPSDHPRLKELQKRLPIDWQGLMGKLERVS